jgi:hypothetical protein
MRSTRFASLLEKEMNTSAMRLRNREAYPSITIRLFTYVLPLPPK